MSEEKKRWRRFRRERFRVIWFATGQSIRSINTYSKVIGDRNFVHSMHQGTLYGNDSFILDARHSAIVGNGNTLQQGRNSVLIGRANRILECVSADANRLVFVDLIKKPTVYRALTKMRSLLYTILTKKETCSPQQRRQPRAPAPWPPPLLCTRRQACRARRSSRGPLDTCS
jgi:hypothetical protein